MAGPNRINKPNLSKKTPAGSKPVDGPGPKKSVPQRKPNGKIP